MSWCSTVLMTMLSYNLANRHQWHQCDEQCSGCTYEWTSFINCSKSPPCVFLLMNAWMDVCEPAGMANVRRSACSLSLCKYLNTLRLNYLNRCPGAVLFKLCRGKVGTITFWGRRAVQSIIGTLETWKRFKECRLAWHGVVVGLEMLDYLNLKMGAAALIRR